MTENVDKSSTITYDDVYKSLNYLSSLFKVVMQGLPVFITDNEDSYTTSEGIFISSLVPVEDLSTIIAHEIAHHVFGMQDRMYTYGAEAFNTEQDYVINNWLLSFGLDVRKCKYKGLLDYEDTDLDTRLKNYKKGNFKYTQYMCPNDVKRVAVQIAYKWGIERHSLMCTDLMDEIRFCDELSSEISTDLPIDLYHTTHFITKWMCDGESIQIDYDNKKCNASQLLCWKLPSWSRKCFDNYGAGIACANLYYNNISNHSAYLKYLYYGMKTRLRNYEKGISEWSKKLTSMSPKYSSKLCNKWLDYYKEKYDNLLERMDNFIIKGADERLNLKRIPRKVKSKKFLNKTTLIKDPDVLPYLKPAILFRQLGWCLRKAYRDVEISLSLYRQLEKIYRSLGVNDKPKHSTNEVSSANNAQTTDNADSKNSNSGDSYSVSTITKKHIDNTVAYSLLNINKLKRTIQHIIKFKGMFDSRLSLKHNKIVDDYSSVTSYSLGNDIMNLDLTEISLLANINTKLDFLVKLSQSSLLQRSNMSTNRLPVFIHIDNSGSMCGSRYEKAVAYTLAITSLLRKEYRGVVINVFSDNVDYHLCLDGKSAVSMQDFVRLFVVGSCPGGGTDFMKSLQHAHTVADERNWTRCVHLCLTDGQFDINLNEKRLFDKIYGCFFARVDLEGLKDSHFFDQVFDCTGDTNKSIKVLKQASMHI